MTYITRILIPEFPSLTDRYSPNFEKINKIVSDHEMILTGLQREFVDPKVIRLSDLIIILNPDVLSSFVAGCALVLGIGVVGVSLGLGPSVRNYLEDICDVVVKGEGGISNLLADFKRTGEIYGASRTCGGKLFKKRN